MACHIGSLGSSTQQLSARSRAASSAVPAINRPNGLMRERSTRLTRLRTSGVMHVATPSPPASWSSSTAPNQPTTASGSDSLPSTSASAPQQTQPHTDGPQAHSGPLMLSGGAFVLPHPDKIAKGGEDWYFISGSKRAMGVADGVGGWAEVGVDAGAYARQLMNNARDAADRVVKAGPGNGAGSVPLSAQAILEVAYAQTRVMGSSTACIMVLNGSTLTASNLGDSGFMVVREGETLMSTTQQQHSFNFPFQIGSSDAMGDHPGKADRYEVQLLPGDMIVVGTDGLWDNCFQEEVVAVLKYCKEGAMPPAKVAQVLAHYARHRAADTKFASPFAYSAYASGIKYLGGKMDDITIVIAVAEPSTHQQQQQEQQQPAQPVSKL